MICNCDRNATIFLLSLEKEDNYSSRYYDMYEYIQIWTYLQLIFTQEILRWVRHKYEQTQKNQRECHHNVWYFRVRQVGSTNVTQENANIEVQRQQGTDSASNTILNQKSW